MTNDCRWLSAAPVFCLGSSISTPHATRDHSHRGIGQLLLDLPLVIIACQLCRAGGTPTAGALFRALCDGGFMHPTIAILVVGLSPHHLGPNTPHLSRLARAG